MSSSNQTRPSGRIKRACDSCKASKLRCNGVLSCMRCVRRDGNVNSPQSILYTPTQAHISRPFLDAANSPQATSQQQPAQGAPSFPNSSRSSVDPVEDVRQEKVENPYLGPTSGISFLSRTWRRLQQLGSRAPDSLASQTSVYTTSSTVQDGDNFGWLHKVKFPDAKQGEDWAETYFNLAMPTYRLFHEPTVMSEWLPKLYVDDDGSCLKERLSKIPPARVAVVLMIFATTALYTTEQCNNMAATGEMFGEEGEPFFAAAQQQLSNEGSHPSLESVQARIQQCIYLLSASRASEAACIFGTTIQLALSLGLHRKKVSGRHSSDFINLQCRKRVFLALYTLDRYISVVLGRPCMIREEDFDQETPDRINDQDMEAAGPKKSPMMSDCLMDAPVLHAEVAAVIGHISRDIYSIRPRSATERLLAVESHIATLHTWKTNLPPIFQIRPSSLTTLFKRQSNVLQLAYSHAIIYATRPFLPTNFSFTSSEVSHDMDQTSQLSKFIAEGCKAAVEVTRIVHTFVQDDFNLQAFWFTQYTAFCAVMFLYVHCMQINNKSQEQGYMELAERCQMEITRATNRNPSAQRYSVILEELRLEVRRQIRNQLQTGLPLTQTISTNNGLRGTELVNSTTMTPNIGGDDLDGASNVLRESIELVGGDIGEEVQMMPFTAFFSSGALLWEDDINSSHMADFSLNWLELDSLASLNYPFDAFMHFQ